ncbi:hypothetical protein GOEFS_060_00340 [Gordonia effusa NBRC 100432]|uniref:Uncharacterized protein n=1 Tax=Gordonia effusa NBRC 100432 TaxID=1077974 RepID=H0R0P0_9ACTN|nr:hypothetical protein GOEFS_060_00340 [Gordonia effusa NBRC 100432]
MTPKPLPGDYVRPDGNWSSPHVTTPHSGAGDKNSVSPKRVTVVQMEEQAWRARAEVASWGAEELRVSAAVVSGVLAHNYLGSGCTEGERVFSALRLILSTGSNSWSSALFVSAETLENLTEACKTTRSQIEAGDKRNGTNIGSEVQA